MNDSNVLETEGQIAPAQRAPDTFEAAIALLRKGDTIQLERKTSEIVIRRGLNGVEVALSVLGFAASYYGQEGENKFVTHCANIAKSINLSLKLASDDGHFVTMELI